MNILVSINHGYLRHFLIMYQSLTEHNGDNHNLFVMSSDLTKDDKDEICKRFKSNVTFIDLTDDYFKGFPKVKRWPYTVYYRILAPILLPEEIDRVLYLDSDLIVHGDLSEFYNVDFEGNAFYACTQIKGFLTWFNQVRLCVKSDYIYMNTGVMMMNLAYLRERIDLEKIKKFVFTNKWKLTLFDQDVLCKFFGNKVKLADRYKYNLADRHIRRFNRFKKKQDRIDLDWVEKNNVIVHYLGPNKPWKKKYRGILKDYYTKYVET